MLSGEFGFREVERTAEMMCEMESTFFNLLNAQGKFKKSPHRKVGAFHPLEWYYDSIGCGWG